MILRCVRSSLPLYGLFAIIDFARTGPTPGSLSSSSALAEFISTNCFACANLMAVAGARRFRRRSRLCECRQREEQSQADRGQVMLPSHHDPSAAEPERNCDRKIL